MTDKDNRIMGFKSTRAAVDTSLTESIFDEGMVFHTRRPGNYQEFPLTWDQLEVAIKRYFENCNPRLCGEECTRLQIENARLQGRIRGLETLIKDRDLTIKILRDTIYRFEEKAREISSWPGCYMPLSCTQSCHMCTLVCANRRS